MASDKYPKRLSKALLTRFVSLFLLQKSLTFWSPMERTRRRRMKKDDQEKRLNVSFQHTQAQAHTVVLYTQHVINLKKIGVCKEMRELVKHDLLLSGRVRKSQL